MSRTASPVVLATDEADARAVDAVVAHHAELSGALQAHVAALLAAASSCSDGRFTDAARASRARLVAFLTGELFPHAEAEESALYPAAARHDCARLLVEAMIGEHHALQDLAREVAAADTPLAAAAAARALAAVFAGHLSKENDAVLPLLAADPATSLASLLEGMHDLLGREGGCGDGGCGCSGDAGDPAAQADAAPVRGGCGDGGRCGCGESDDAVPVLDARTIPHAIRHATVLGAFDALAVGGSFDLVAPHDPLPLLDQLRARGGGRLGVDYLERGPQAWRLRLTRA
ncbi:MAG: DUF2249 domain-containing protein [Kineosporiaceae bacterium]